MKDCWYGVFYWLWHLYKYNWFVKFQTCRTCSLKHRKGSKDANYSCAYSDKERAFVGTWTHTELNYALDRGYHVIYLIRTLDYKKWSKDLFKAYVEQFMRLKISASGWPKNCVTNDEKAAFILENKERYNIELDPNSIKYNSGRRYIAKLCNNRYLNLRQTYS